VPAGLDTRASAYAALLANRFTYALGDPFNDWSTPYSIMMERTAPLRQRVLDRQPVRGIAISDDLTVLPMASGDDFQFVSGGELMPRTQIISRLMKQFEEARRLGGPFVLPIHTQLLGDGDARDIVKSALAAFKDEQASFMNVRNYLAWWKGKSALSYKAEIVSPTEIDVRVTNVGSVKAENVSLRMAGHNEWQIVRRDNEKTGDSSSADATRGETQIVIKSLEPGTSVGWVLRKRNATRN
jgi:hypothetical protein